MLYVRLWARRAERWGGDSGQHRARWGVVGACTGVAVNLLLTLVKFIVGTRTGSLAAAADAANNLSDAGASVMSLIAARISRRRETARNPFGYGRMEYLGALGVGALIVVMGAGLLRSGIQSILRPSPVAFSYLSLTLLCVSILGKLWLYAVQREIGLSIRSEALLAAAKDSLSDCAATGAVVVSMLAARLLGVVIDGYVGALVSLLVLKAGWDVMRQTVDKLLGGAPDQEVGDEILRRVSGYEYVLGTHDFVLHDYGPGRAMASVHVEVPFDGDLVAMHEVVDRMERDIWRDMRIPLCVHMDPVKPLDEAGAAARRALMEYLSQREAPLRLHDFRVVPGGERVNLVFDVVLPPALEASDALADEIRARARLIDERYECVIHFDKDYYHVQK